MSPIANPGGEAAEWIRDFEAAARRPLAERLRYAFTWTYKPDLFVEKSPENGRALVAEEAAGRLKDRETLPRLRAFRDWWMSQHRS